MPKHQQDPEQHKQARTEARLRRQAARHGMKLVKSRSDGTYTVLPFWPGGTLDKPTVEGEGLSLADAITVAEDSCRDVRVMHAGLGLQEALRLLQDFNEVAQRDGITLQDWNAPWFRKRFVAEAEKLRLAEVYGIVEDDELDRLLANEDG